MTISMVTNITMSRSSSYNQDGTLVVNCTQLTLTQQ